MKRTVQEEVCLMVKEWAKNGLIKRKTMFLFIGTSIPVLEKTGHNVRNGKCVYTISDYVCYLIEVLIDSDEALNVLAYLRVTDKTLYNDVLDLLVAKDLVTLTKSKLELLESKNLEKVEKLLRTKLDKQIKAKSNETQNNV